MKNPWVQLIWIGKGNKFITELAPQLLYNFLRSEKPKISTCTPLRYITISSTLLVISICGFIKLAKHRLADWLNANKLIGVFNDGIHKSYSGEGTLFQNS